MGFLKSIGLSQKKKKSKNSEISLHKEEKESDNNLGMTGGRRASSSVTAQLSRQARRFSTAIAPTLTKIEVIQILQKLEVVEIKISDITQLQSAIENYVMRNSVQFDPVEFDIFNKEGFRFMRASVYPDEIILQESDRKICEITLIDSDDPSSMLKIRHPVSGMTNYELRELGGTILVQTNTDDLKGARIMTQTSGVSTLFMQCGCLFSKETWSVLTQDRCVAVVHPIRSFFNENEMKIEWSTSCENELRLISLAFGIGQMIRIGFPQLFHIVKEFRQRNQ